MSQKQEELFLYVWSRRRARGARTVAWRGATIGAIGGFVFAWVIAPGPGSNGAHAYDFLGQLTANFWLYILATLGCAVVGAINAYKIFARQELMYHSLLESGLKVPAEKPQLTLSQRGPAIAVGITIAVIVIFIIVVAAMYL